MNLPLLVFPRVALGDTLMGLAGVTLTSLLAAVWPVSLVVRLEPMEAMRA